MIVVSDASPLAALSAIQQVDLLAQLYGRVLIPEAVWRELVAGKRHAGRNQVLNAPWIERRSVENRQLVMALLQDLDEGEAEALALAVETDADLLIIDERIGRRTAQHFGVNVIGVIGVLVDAKHHSLIVQIRPILDQLRSLAGFHISEALYQRVLADEGETP